MTSPRPGPRPFAAGVRPASRARLGALLLALLALPLPPAASAQAPHELEVRIPNYIGIKMLRPDGGLAVRPRVLFDYASAPDAYVARVAAGGGELEPTSVVDFEDVQVTVLGGIWAVHVQAEPLRYAGPEAGAGLALGDVRVRPGASSSLAVGARVRWRSGGWPLGAAPRWIAWGRGNTGGWTSLGFNGYDYRLAVQGDEDPGAYATVVTYTLFNP